MLCDPCLERNARPRFAIRGLVLEHGRIPIDALVEPFAHDRRLHPELAAMHAAWN